MLNPHAPAFTPSKPQPQAVAQVYTGSFLKPLRPSTSTSMQFRTERHSSNPVSGGANGVGGYGVGEPISNGFGGGGYGIPPGTGDGGTPSYMRQQHIGGNSGGGGGHRVGHVRHPQQQPPQQPQYDHQSMAAAPRALPFSAAEHQRNTRAVSDISHSFQSMSLASPPEPSASASAAAGVALPVPPPTAARGATAVSVASSALRLPAASAGGVAATTSTATAAATSSSSSSSSKQQVCKYYLMGECKIINCGFLHTTETQSAVCRYWQWGECRRGDHCRFLHRNVDPTPTTQAAPTPNSSSSGAAPTSGSASQQSSAVPLSQHLRPQQRQRLLPTSSAGDGGHFRDNDLQPFDAHRAFPHFQSSPSTAPPHAAGGLNSASNGTSPSHNNNASSIISASASHSTPPSAIPFSSLASLSSDFLSPTALTRSQSSPADMVQPPSSTTSSHDVISGKSTSTSSSLTHQQSQSNSSSPNSAPAPSRSLFQFGDAVLGGTSPSLTWSPNPPLGTSPSLTWSSNPPPGASPSLTWSSNPPLGASPSLTWSPNPPPGSATSAWPPLGNDNATTTTSNGNSNSGSGGGGNTYGRAAADAEGRTPPLLLDLASSAAFPAIGSEPAAPTQQPLAPTHQPQPSPPSSAAPSSSSSSSYMDLASRFKLEDLQRRHFPHVDASAVEAAFKAHACHFKGTEQALLKRYGPVPAAMKASVQPGPKLPAAIPHPSLNYAKDAPFVKQNPWVATGTEVGILYEKYRSDAVDHALQRNAMFQKAADAYLRGDGKLAREFSDRGHFHDEAMHAGHAKAARVIFDSRNASNAVSADGHLTLDFHGLHRQEAAHILEEKLGEVAKGNANASGRSRPRVRTVDLVLGTGHHSTGGKPILLPAVLEFLSSHKYAHREVSHGGRGGIVRVMLDSSSNNSGGSNALKNS